MRVGTEGTYPPFTYMDPRTGQLTGYDIEVAEAVAKEAGWRLQFVQSQFDAIFPALDTKRIDMIANQVTINPERQARYLFSEPYTYSHGVIVIAADNEGHHDPRRPEGQDRPRSRETSNWAQVAKDAGAKVESVEGFAQAGDAARPGPRRRDRQRQHRRARLPGLDGVEEDQDRRRRRRRDLQAGADLPQGLDPQLRNRPTRP